jgi:hypothetical protein
MKKRILIPAILLVTVFATASAADLSSSSQTTSSQLLFTGYPGNNPVSPAEGHNILSSQLPAVLLADIKKNYKDYWISELYEEGSKKEPSSYITLENADQIIKLTSADSESWDVTSTISKGV